MNEEEKYENALREIAAGNLDGETLDRFAERARNVARKALGWRQADIISDGAVNGAGAAKTNTQNTEFTEAPQVQTLPAPFLNTESEGV